MSAKRIGVTLASLIVAYLGATIVFAVGQGLAEAYSLVAIAPGTPADRALSLLTVCAALGSALYTWRRSAPVSVEQTRERSEAAA